MSDTSRRRPTPLALQLVKEIAAGGSISVADYMRRCLADPLHGYYTTKAGIGRSGDFVTAPEISQVFGELIGLWSAVAWQQMGAPSKVRLIELGPGRGVLMDDALRAARLVPAFLNAIELHLCEINPEFRQMQSERLRNHKLQPQWHADMPEPAAIPTIIIANEFLDTLPATQWRKDGSGNWLEVRVDIDDNQLAFNTAPATPPFDGAALPEADAEAVYTHLHIKGLAEQLSEIARAAPTVILYIDYGHAETSWGDTLQAVRKHQPEHPLTSPGEADLSIAVDFAAVSRASEQRGLVCDGPVTQADFLGQLGAAERTSALMSANRDRAGDIESGVHRLMATPGMGSRFLALAARSPTLSPLPGFTLPVG